MPALPHENSSTSAYEARPAPCPAGKNSACHRASLLLANQPASQTISSLVLQLQLLLHLLLGHLLLRVLLLLAA
jgi:hypothetical protein